MSWRGLGGGRGGEGIGVVSREVHRDRLVSSGGWESSKE